MMIRNSIAFFLLLVPAAAPAAIVWVLGEPGITTVEFSKTPGSNPTNAANQDPVAPGVTLTRGNFGGGLFNIELQNGYQDEAPAGTEWAFANLNGNPPMVSANDFSDLNFAPWRTAAEGGSGSLTNGNLVDNGAVVHLIDLDIYLDLQFTAWGQGSGNGSFAYTRAAGPIPEPAFTYLALIGSVSLLASRRRI